MAEKKIKGRKYITTIFFKRNKIYLVKKVYKKNKI